MNETIIKYWGQLTQYWHKINQTQKTILLAIVGVIVIALIMLILIFSRTEYSKAFNDLDPNDAAAITQYLSSQGISYKLSDDGKSIGVPTKEASQVKINVESQGLMKNGSIGYGIFRDNLSGFSMTDNEFNVLKVDALAGEIQQVLRQMNGVVSSKVIINLPQQSVFLNDSKDPSTAVVMLNYKLGYRPDQQQIDTIFNLVAHSVPNLDLADITVSDQNGELIPSSKTPDGLGNAAGLVAQQFEIKKQFERDIQNNVHQLLGTMMGSGNVVVSVVSSLNFDKKNSKEQLVTPVNTVDQKGLEISVEKIQESYTSNGAGDPGGIPGTGDSQVPGYPTSSTAGGSTSSDKSTERINYDVNRITNDIIASPYKVTDLTINVAVEPPNANDPQSLDEDTKAAFQRILMNIVGTSLANSGQTLTDDELARKVSVIAHSFVGNQIPSSAGWFSNQLFNGFGIALLLAALIGGFLLYRRRKSGIEEEEFSAKPIKAEIPELGEMEQDNQVRRQLESLAKKKPEEFVNLLRTWLVEE